MKSCYRIIHFLLQIFIGFPIAYFLVLGLAKIFKEFHDRLLEHILVKILHSFDYLRIQLGFTLYEFNTRYPTLNDVLNSYQLIILWVLLIVTIYYLEFQRVGKRSTHATILRLAQYVSKYFYKLFRTLIEFLAVLIEMIIVVLTTEGLKDFFIRIWGRMKDSISGHP